MEDVDKRIQRFKEKNGGAIEYTYKEMFAAIWERFDDLPCVEHIETIKENETRSKLLMYFIPVSLTVIAILITLLLAT